MMALAQNQPSPADIVQLWTAILVIGAAVIGVVTLVVRHFTAEIRTNKRAIEEERTERQRRDDETYRRLDRCQENERRLNEEFRTTQATVLTTNAQQIERVTDTLVAVQKTVETASARSHEDSQAICKVLEKLDDHVDELLRAEAGRRTVR